MSSNNPGLEPLPHAIPSMWRALKRGYVSEPALLVVSFTLALLAALPDALFALWLMFLAMGLTEQNETLTWLGVSGLGISAALSWALRVVSDRTQRRFRDRVSIALESHVAELQASVVTVSHHERPEYLDRLAVLRNQVFTLDHMYLSMFSTAGWLLRLGVTGVLLASIHPALLALVLFALPTVGFSTWRPGVERAAEEQGAPDKRLAMHLFDVATTAPPGKEVRLTGIGGRIAAARKMSFNRWYQRVANARNVSAIFHCIAWAIFGLGFVMATVFVVYVLDATPAQTLLLLAAGSRLSAYISATVGELGFLRGIWMDGSKRLAWLEDYAKGLEIYSPKKAPNRLSRGIKFEDVNFAYPGTEQLALEKINLDLQAGSTVAIVGENGAGKTTLVKLLARMYDPSSGSIWVDDERLTDISARDWRKRLAGAFQDFFRFEFPAQNTVGLGDVVRIDDREAAQVAVERAGAEDVVRQLDQGLDTQLGVSWPNGVEVSFGQWQKLSLARGFMRDEPLLLILDEPTAALDAETEHALFERYAAQTQSNGEAGGNSGRITILVSHRFSTVRMADQIVVMDGSRIVETGTHEDLLESGKQYAELYTIQASAYQ